MFSLCVLISASITTNYYAQTLPIVQLTAANGVRSIQFLIFLSLMSMLIETTILLVRFMNVKIINNYSTVAFAVVSEIMAKITVTMMVMSRDIFFNICLLQDSVISGAIFLALLISSSIALRAVDVYNFTQIESVAAQSFSTTAVSRKT